MRRTRRIPLPALVLAAGLAVLAAQASADGPDVGVAAAVNPDATGTPPDAEPRVIQIGLDVVRNERIVTGAQGRTQLLFVDGSALTVGPNAEVILDEFVFDPDSGTGRLALSASRGVLRLVGGRISKRSPMVLKTPTATIGIRGGIAIVEVGARTVASFLFGRQMTVTSGGVTKSAERPGFQIVSAGADQSPSEPAPIPAASIGASLGSLEGVAGSSGGAEAPPTDESIAGTQIADLSSNQPPPPQPTGAGTPPPAQLASLSEENSQVTESAQDAAQAETVASNVLDTPFRYGGLYVSRTPFALFDFDDATATRVPARYRPYSGGRISNGRVLANLNGSPIVLPAQTGEFQFGPAGTTSPFGPVAGEGFVSPDADFFFYNLREVANGNNPSALFGGVPSSMPGTLIPIRAYSLHAGFPGTHDVPFLPPAFGGDFPADPLPPLYWSLRRDAGNANEASSVGWGAVIIQGQGANQRSLGVGTTASFFTDSNGNLTFGGFAAASVRRQSTEFPVRVGNGNSAAMDGDGNAFFGLGDQGARYFVVDSDQYDNAGNRLPAAGFAQTFEDLNEPNPFFQSQIGARRQVPGGVGEGRISLTIQGYTAGLAEARLGLDGMGNPVFDSFVFNNQAPGPGGVTIAMDALNNRVFATFNIRDVTATAPALTFFWGNPVGANRSRGAFVDNRVFVMRERRGLVPDGGARIGGVDARSRGAVVTSHFFADRSTVPASVDLCSCEFLVWGFWLDDLREDTFINGQRYRVHLAPWVAGVLPDLGDIQSAGTAQYDGHAVANIRNGADRYIAFGNFNLNWSFASRTGMATITNLDGVNYSASVTSQNGREVTGTLSGQGRTGTIETSFYRGGGDPSAAAAGEFAIQETAGPAYRAGGVVLGQKQ